VTALDFAQGVAASWTSESGHIVYPKERRPLFPALHRRPFREVHMASAIRLPIVGVVGSASDEHQERAAALGCWLAGQGVHLLTGGGQGVMAAVSRAFAESPGRKGLVLGIIPCIAEDKPEVSKPGYPNAWIEVPIRTHLHLSGQQGEHPRSRNHLVALTATALVALPGGAGTASEVRLALRYKKPLIAYLKARDEIPGLPPEVKSEPDLNQVKAFIVHEIARFQSENKLG
jgi:uncharacterized protein (TIGR00725 family)